MSTRTYVERYDDLSGESGAEVFEFALDGQQYEIDLIAPNADKYREMFAELTNAARKIGKAKHKRARVVPEPVEKPDPAVVRVWAAENGYEVSPRGRVAQHVIDAYLAA